MMRRFLLMVTLALSGCAGLAPLSSSGTTAAPQTQQFLSAVEARRQAALTVTERAAVLATTAGAKQALNSTQNQFTQRLAGMVGLDASIVSALFPEWTKPVSEQAAVTRLERALGKPLSDVQSASVRSATALRNNSLSQLRQGTAEQVGRRTGLSADVVLALMPLIGL